MRSMAVGFFDSWRSMAEDEMMWCEVESSLNLFASPDKLDVVYLELVSVSLTARY